MTAALEGGEWSAERPGRTLLPEKDTVTILQETGWAPGPVWTGGKSRPHQHSIPDRPARSQSLYRLSYPYIYIYIHIHKQKKKKTRNKTQDKYTAGNSNIRDFHGLTACSWPTPAHCGGFTLRNTELSRTPLYE